VAADEKIFQELLAELLSERGHLLAFGAGLAHGAADPLGMWSRMIAQIATIADDQLNLQLLQGFLKELHACNSGMTDAILDESCSCPILGQRYPLLQTAVRIDKRGFERLRRSLALGKAPIEIYSILAYGRGLHHVQAADLRVLLEEIASKQGGLETALEILAIRLHSDAGEPEDAVDEILEAGRGLMRQFAFTKRHDTSEDYRLSMVVKSCFINKDGAALTVELCHKLIASASSHSKYEIGHDCLLKSLFSVQPAATLDGLFGGGEEERKRGLRLFEHLRGDPLFAIPEDVLWSWCDQEPETRYEVIAAAITPFSSDDESTPPRWTGLALQLLTRAPDRVKILEQFIAHFWPRGAWAGSRATILEANAKLLDQLNGYSDAALVAFVNLQKVSIAEAVKEERRCETLSDRDRDERFE
jgi:hypothetical protein